MSDFIRAPRVLKVQKKDEEVADVSVITTLDVFFNCLLQVNAKFREFSVQNPPTQLDDLRLRVVLQAEQCRVELKELFDVRILIEHPLSQVGEESDIGDAILAFELLVLAQSDNLLLKVEDVKDVLLKDTYLHKVVVGPYVQFKHYYFITFYKLV